MNVLASSDQFRILHEYETVWLEAEGRGRIVIGDFYGDPKMAIIDAGERWCVIGGCGLIIYFLQEPFDHYAYNEISTQYREVGRAHPNIWWVNAIEQIGVSEIMVTLETGEIHTIETILPAQ